MASLVTCAAQAGRHCILPDSIQHTGCDALSSGQAEDPDPADATQSLFWDGGAAPGSVSLHEVVLGHILESIWLLEDSVSLNGQKVDWHQYIIPNKHNLPSYFLSDNS